MTTQRIRRGCYLLVLHVSCLVLLYVLAHVHVLPNHTHSLGTCPQDRAAARQQACDGQVSNRTVDDEQLELLSM